jgi:WD40 repeat protein
MRAHRLLAALALLVALGAQASGHVLFPAKRIGFGWNGARQFSWMSFVAFSPDGKEVASDGPAEVDEASNEMTLWSFPAGKLIRELVGRPSVMAPDWQYYATENEIWSTSSGERVFAANGTSYAEFAFETGSRHAAVSGVKGAAIRIVELPSGKIVETFGTAVPESLAYSPDHKLVAAGYWDFVALWDVRSGKRMATLRGAGRYVDGLSFSAHGRLLAAGTDAGTVQVWDVRAKRRIRRFSVDGGYVSQPAFDPLGRYVAFGTYGTGTVWLADLRSGRIVDHGKVSDLGCGSVAFSPDGRYLIAPSTGGLITWPADAGGTIRVFRVLRHEARDQSEDERPTTDRARTFGKIVKSIETIIKSTEPRPGRQPQQ